MTSPLANAPLGTADVAADPPVAVLSQLSLATRRVAAVTVAERLEELQQWLAGSLASLEAALGDALTDDGTRAYDAAVHLLSQPGKRVRPLCVMLAARLGSARPADVPFDRAVAELAIAVELVHTATLLHDDVIDLGTERRGAPTARTIHGNAASVLGGDEVLLEALRRVHAVGDPGLMASVLDVIGGMVSAEAMQLERRGRFDPDRDVYLAIIEGKTAALFAWALRAGATVGGLDEAQRAALATAGHHLGLAFQLVDDVLDVERTSGEMGKDAFADLREGKLTWPLITACERDQRLVDGLRAVAERPDLLDDAAFVAGLRDRLLATGCVAETQAVAQQHAAAARQALGSLPPGRARAALLAIVDACVARIS